MFTNIAIHSLKPIFETFLIADGFLIRSARLPGRGIYRGLHFGQRYALRPLILPECAARQRDADNGRHHAVFNLSGCNSPPLAAML